MNSINLETELLSESSSLNDKLALAIQLGIRKILSQQTPKGYWWYTLEANETIAAEYIFLEHCLGRKTLRIWNALANRMLSEQLSDGSWRLAYGLEGDPSTTLECYVALRMIGFDSSEPALQRAREYIIRHNALERARVFTKIHFAMLGIIPWSQPPAMPVEIMLLPSWAPISIYSFSSWARACVVPLLIMMTQQPVWPLPIVDLVDELSPNREHAPNNQVGKLQLVRDALSKAQDVAVSILPGRGVDIWGEFFRWVDRAIKLTHPFTRRRPTKRLAVKRCEEWIRQHIASTEDIFPALSYAVLSLKSLGYSEDDPTIQKAVRALHRFQHSYHAQLPPIPFHQGSSNWQYEQLRINPEEEQIHQQCCISPVWDTPWAVCALRAAGVSSDNQLLLKADQWMVSKQINHVYGDWHHKNSEGKPGGWSFEFENDFFPDVDDTIQVLLALHGTIPWTQLAPVANRALAWCMTMQNDDGGWAAFDKNNSMYLLNKIPFSDHGACLDPSSPDITGRMLQLLSVYDVPNHETVVQRALTYLRNTQRTDGSWFGRWGINFIYGTWAVLEGLKAISVPPHDTMVSRAVAWLKSIQHDDGGFGESPASYSQDKFISMEPSASQTAWGLMAMLTLPGCDAAVTKSARWLIQRQNNDGSWMEQHYTGTGFPGHFYIRYHGYRHYFPLMALAKYRASISCAAPI